MKKVFRLLLCISLLLCIALAVPVHAAEAAPVSSFAYDLRDGKLILNSYIGSNSTVVVPGTYRLDGVSYPVVLNAETVFAEHTGIRSVTLGQGVTFLDHTMSGLFYGCSSLRWANLREVDTSDISDMSYLFCKCSNLTAVDMSGLNTAKVSSMTGMFYECKSLEEITGYGQWDTSSLVEMDYMFASTASLRKLDLRSWSLENLQNSGWCFQTSGVRELLLPENIAVISAGFFNHVVNYDKSFFTVPSGVKEIGYAHTFYDFGTGAFQEFRVAEGNRAIQSLDGILYTADGKKLLAVPRAKTFSDGVYEIPEGVTFLGELSFSRNYNIRKVILPDSFRLRMVELYDPEYIIFEDTGNINRGLNLNIAIYAYTGVTEYAVKPSNPNYQSRDGILYSKDMTQLLAVPTRYEGKLSIPEGVAQWQAGAMWCAGDTLVALMRGCEGVSIPASMVSIAPDQLDKLNRLHSKFDAFTITVDPENPVYYLGSTGKLMQKPLLADAQITMPADTLVYTGKPLMPKPEIRYNGTLLVEGTDYTLSYANNTDAGTAWVRIDAMGMLYGSAECTFSIEPAAPVVIPPKSVQAVYGQQLKELPMPEHMTWTEPEQIADAVGKHVYTAVYDRKDPNFQRICDIKVTVQVLPKPLTQENVRMEKVAFLQWPAAKILPTVQDGETVLSEEEYTLSYANTHLYGRASVRIQSVPGGNYAFNLQIDYLILPGPVELTLVLLLLWVLTTGRSIRKQRRASAVEKPNGQGRGDEPGQISQ